MPSPAATNRGLLELVASIKGSREVDRLTQKTNLIENKQTIVLSAFGHIPVYVGLVFRAIGSIVFLCKADY